MSLVKIQWRINAGRYSWTERFYMSTATNVNEAIASAIWLAGSRNSTLVEPYFIERLSVLDMVIPRSSIELDVAQLASPQKQTALTDPSPIIASPPWRAALARLNVKTEGLPPSPGRNFFMRGVPTRLWTGSYGAGWALDPVLANAYPRYFLDRLVKGGTKTNPNRYGPFMMLAAAVVMAGGPVLGVALDSATGFTSLTTGAGPWNGPTIKYVVVTGFKKTKNGVSDWTKLNGKHLVADSSAAAPWKLLVRVPYASLVGPQVSNNPLVNGFGLSPLEINGYTLSDEPAKKNTGKASGGTKGRYNRRPASL